MEGVGEVSDGLDASAPALQVTIDRKAAAEKGLTVAQVYMQIAAALQSSASVSDVTLDSEDMDLTVDAAEGSVLKRENLLELELSAESSASSAMTGSTSGMTGSSAAGQLTGGSEEDKTFKLGDVATVTETVSMNTISRDQQRRCVTVTAAIADGYNVTHVTSAAQQAVSGLTLPEGITAEFNGENEQIMEAMSQLLLMLLLGIVQPVAYFIFENYGILYTSAAVAGTIIAAVPVCCILMDVLVLHERVTRRQVLCALGAIGGVALISVGGAVMISALGLLFLLLTMLSDTVYYGLSHDAAKRFTPFEMTYVMFVVGMAVFIPVALIQAGGISSELITAPAQSGSFWLAVLYLGILSSGVAYGLLNFANSHLTVSESSLFSNVTTVVSVLAGVLFLKEDFSLW